MDITVNIPCDIVSVTAYDFSDDKLLVNELLQFQSVDLDLSSGHLISEKQKEDTFHEVFKRAKKSKYAKKKTAKDAKHSACRVYGSFPVNKVRGDLQITTKFSRYGLNVLELEKLLNFTHIIDEFSFGEFYPKLVNPLDGVVAVAENSMQVYQYFLCVVPTTYKSYSTGSSIQTNQYAVTERAGVSNYHQGLPPGIIFKYDIEPIALTVFDRRLPFSQFLVRLVNVLGGIVVSTSWLYTVADKFLYKRSDGSDRGVLDSPVDDILNEKS
ncbi:Erv41p [Sugiyamaella lignohabitans]|uniref:Endoplasmic reticulum-Golgi intermediate compartment protein n=1 Tax=Sugiyamaella lignohabitans TaxID=796027 RepID=A0A161HNE0_9ASCO|nr:Erv41p [Sugiyamaella lignohabitans]ANB15647.1 Erv41p [Sugiyamaella lignohabitans]